MASRTSDAEHDVGRNTDGASQASAPQNGRPFYQRPSRMLLFAAILVTLVLAGGWYWFYSKQFVSTDDAFLEGDLVQVAPQVAGPITAIAIDEHETVKTGDALLRVDPADYRLALSRARVRHESAEAQLLQAKAGVAVARAEVEQAESNLEVARTELENARSDLERLQQVDRRAIQAQQLEDAKDRVAQTRARRRAAAKKLTSTEAAVASAEARVASARAAVREADVAIDAAKLDLSYTTIAAPADGQVVTLGVETGEYVSPGQTLLSIARRTAWVKANFKETQITHMRPGQAVDIHIDAYPARTFRGRVKNIQRATGSQLALLPPQNATGNFVKVVQRVPVEIVFEAPPDVHTLAPGLSVVPTVRVLPNPPWPW